MKAPGIQLQYRFDAGAQRGATVDNALFDLLHLLRQHASIRHAAAASGRSYRHVWGAIKQWEKVLGQGLVTWAQGQPARLTPFAERLLSAETGARSRMAPHIEALRGELQRVMSDALDGVQHTLTLHGADDPALALLRRQASMQRRLHIELHPTSGLDGLRALAFDHACVAALPVPCFDSAAPLWVRNLRPLLKASQHRFIGCLRRRQGLMTRGGGVSPLRSLAEAVARGTCFVQRPPGSLARLLVQQLLQAQGLDDSALRAGQGGAQPNDLAAAAAIARGDADAAVGLEAAAAELGLDFHPLLDEDLLLVCHKDALQQSAVALLHETLVSADWAQALATLVGYQAVYAGQALPLARALPWWKW